MHIVLKVNFVDLFVMNCCLKVNLIQFNKLNVFNIYGNIDKVEKFYISSEVSGRNVEIIKTMKE